MVVKSLWLFYKKMGQEKCNTNVGFGSEFNLEVYESY